MWTLAFGWSLSVRLYSFLTGEVTANFSASRLFCLPIYHTTRASNFTKVYGLIYFVIPILVLLVSTVWLFLYVNKTSGISKPTVLTLALVSGVFLLAYGPFCVLVFLHSFLYHGPGLIVFYRFASYIVYLNYAANPIIYFVTLRSYREFVLTKISSWFPTFRL
jgi:hypothetical protein